MRVLVLPRDNVNPYQELLYREFRRRGVEVTYIGSLTPSYTLNQLLLPVELVVRRLAGARLVHLHWVYNFAPYGGDRYRVLRGAAQIWFGLWLQTLRFVGLHLVWTAHNVLPLQRVFADDLRARRQLVSRCDLVIAHSRMTFVELAVLGMVPKSTAVIPHGPFVPVGRPEATRASRSGGGPRRLLFFGNIREYKGVDDLLVAFAALPPGLDVQLTVAGQCDDPALRSILAELAGRSPGCVELRLERLPEDELARLLAEADITVLPFRRSTTSGSAIFALCHGRPIVMPAIPGLAQLPDEAVFRYDGTIQGLTRALTEAILVDTSTLARMSAAADAYCASINWETIAEQTLDMLYKILKPKIDIKQGLMAHASSVREQ
jgi:glycosyltransferase involved in cell wall biosynthesis